MLPELELTVSCNHICPRPNDGASRASRCASRPPLPTSCCAVAAAPRSLAPQGNDDDFELVDDGSGLDEDERLFHQIVSTLEGAAAKGRQHVNDGSTIHASSTCHVLVSTEAPCSLL